MGMHDLGTWQPAIRKETKGSRGEAMPAVPAVGGAEPIPTDVRPEGDHSGHIAGNAT